MNEKLPKTKCSQCGKIYYYDPESVFRFCDRCFERAMGALEEASKKSREPPVAEIYVDPDVIKYE